MRALVLVLICACLFATTALAETVNIKSSAPFILVYGEYVYPVDSVYTVTLTDTSVLVQGKMYEPPKKPFIPSPRPDREKSFIDWVIRTPSDSAMALIEAGGSCEQAKQLMGDFYKQFPESDTFSVRFENSLYPVYRVAYKEKKYNVRVPCRKREPKPDYKKYTLEPAFNELCSYLRAGALVFRSKGIMQPIPAKELTPSLMQQLKGITEQTAIKSPITGDYEGLKLRGKRREIFIGFPIIADLVKANKANTINTRKRGGGS